MPYEYRKFGDQFQLHFVLGKRSAVLATMPDVSVRFNKTTGRIDAHGRPAAVRNSDAGLGEGQSYTITSNNWDLSALNKLIETRGCIAHVEERVRHAAQMDEVFEKIASPKL